MIETKKCPFCEGDIAIEAIKCKHCKKFLVTSGKNTIEIKKEELDEDTTLKNDFTDGKENIETKNINSGNNKKKYIFALFFFIILTCALIYFFKPVIIETKFANGQLKERYEIKTDNQGNEMYNGLYEAWYESGQLKAKGEFKNRLISDNSTGSTGIPLGGRQGKWILWYENGIKESEGYYKDGKSDGFYTSWYENGNKEVEGNIKEDKWNGLKSTWYENGGKKSECYYKNGNIDGLQTYWYEGGNKEAEENYKDGKLHGFNTRWYKNGEMYFKKSYIEGSLSSTEFKDTNYNSDKVILDRQYYDNGQLKFLRDVSINEDGNYYTNGLATSFYENGNKKIEDNWKDGISNGMSSGWFENGNIRFKANYKNGKLEGLYTEWYENGIKKSETNYKDNIAEGLYTVWNGNGRIEANYINGKLDGLYCEYENDKKISEKIYKKGELSYVIFEPIVESEYESVKNITKLKLNLDKYYYKKIKIIITFSTIAVAPNLMFMDSDAQFINVICSEQAKEEIQDIKPNTKCLVYGIVRKDMFGNPEIHANKIQF